MKVVTGKLGRPIQGISQQPNNVRVEGQCSESINMRPDVVKGLTTRIGFHEVASVATGMTEMDKVYFYRRSEGEEYYIIVPQDKASGIKVYNPLGELQELETVEGAIDYLYLEGNETRKLVFKTVGDYTFISNPRVVVEQSKDKSEPLRFEGVVYCQFIDYAQKHSIYADDVLIAEYTSMDGTDNSDPKQKESVKTSKVILELASQINSTGGTGIQKSVHSAVKVGEQYVGTVGHSILTFDQLGKVVTSMFNVTQNKSINWGYIYRGKYTWKRTDTSVKEGDVVEVSYLPEVTNPDPTEALYNAEFKEDSNVLILRKIDGTDFTLRTTDDVDGKNLIAVKGHIEDPSMLPNEAPIGMKVQIYPKGAKPEETYWLEATQPIVNSGLVWKECIAPEVTLGVDYTTMPVSIIRESRVDGKAKFLLDFNQWGDRSIGDDVNNTDPSFVGGKVSEIGLFQNRLFFTSGESVSMSRSSEFFEFYRTTTQTVVATDPYDAYADTKDVIALSAAVGFDGDLILFSESSQHSISGESIVTPENPAPLRKLTTFDSQLDAHPVNSGENIFFAFNAGQYTGIREFFTDSISDTKRARPITDHVSQLIKGKLRLMKSSSSFNKLICQGEDLSKLYIYNWMWQGSEKVQSAWGVWQFRETDKILNVELVNSYIYMLVSRNGNVLFMVADMGDPPDGIDIDFPVRLDNKKIVKATLNKQSNKWEIPNHLTDYPLSEVKVIAGSGVYPEDIGVELRISDTLPLTVNNERVAPEGVEEISVVVGTPFKATYTPSNPFPRDSNGVALSDLDRLQVGRMVFNFDTAGPCVGKVDLLGFKVFEYPLTPRRVGSRSNIVGFALLTAGSFTMPIRTKSNRYLSTIETVSHIPLRIRDVEYQATYQRK